MIWRLFPQARIVLDVFGNIGYMAHFEPTVDYRDAKYRPERRRAERRRAA